ncbi:MAG: HD domain-containing protein [Bacteroidales bacterium]|nr:HD domain-containing protein [Bacteroidales bacterium]MBN2755808.1 HD domain-containing protein [Bacteroidales bacterium]
MEEKKELVFRIQKLINENKDLKSQLKEIKVKYEKLDDDNQNYKNLIAKIPEDALPKGLKAADQTKTLRFRMATVLYLDIQGFKKISESMKSGQVIDELDQIFFQFNHIAEKYKIQKIKTIGDAYMCAGGVPVKNITNPIDVVLAALEMEDYLADLKTEYENQGREFWDLRLGIHTGAVTATTQGRKKISYDLKGDTVNIATRMASASDIGRINISIMTYELVKQYFDCEYHGTIPVKYQGDMDMYFIKRIKKKYSEDRQIGIKPNRIFTVKYLIRQFTDLQEIILDKLERELPDYLFYHNYKHTIDVVNQAELIGYGEGVDDEAILLLMTAALFHDAGHTIGYDNHEYFGTQIAQEWLPKYKYTDKQIDTICDIIMATQLPPQPKTLLQEIICDSDLDYLGRSDFIPVSNTLYEELKAQNKMSSLNTWNKIQVKFLSSHQFFTKTANKLREVNKQAQIERIKQIINWDED